MLAWLRVCWANMAGSTAPFASEKMEAEFQADLLPTTLQMLYTWCFTTALYFFYGFGMFLVHYTAPTVSFGYVVVALCHLVMVVTLMALPVLLFCVTPMRRYITAAVPAVVAAMVAITSLMMQVLTVIATDDALQHMPVLMALTSAHPELYTEVHLYVHAELAKKYLLVHMSLVFFILAVLQYVPYTRSVVVLQIAIPVALVASIYVSPAMPASGRDFMMMTVAPGIISFFQCTQISKMRRKNFEAKYLLQEALSKEADALQKARDLEMLQKEASQKADSILNHILKNIMADAAGTIELFMAGVSGKGELLLDQAIECLHRGMRWCKHRQAILRVASHAYTPRLVPVCLEDLGKDLAQGRQIATRFLDGTFFLDKTLVSIVLDNAINNAYRHGNPTDPQVRFTMSLCPLPDKEDEDEDCFLLGFEVSNRVHEGRPHVSPEFVARILAGEAETTPAASCTLSDNLGLRHMYLAAEAHGMTVGLRQEADVVIFEATVEARMCSTLQRADSVDTEDCALPSGLVVACLDDSEVARRLLAHSLTRQLPQAVVSVFGEAEADVGAFLATALAGAHIVILDQHLMFGQKTVLGTSVIRDLLSRGYPGCIAIRSADSSPEDEAKYLGCGAHLMLSKDLRPGELVVRLTKGYVRFLRRGHGVPSSSSAADLFAAKLHLVMTPLGRSPTSATAGTGNPLDSSGSSAPSVGNSRRTSPMLPPDPLPLPGSVNPGHPFHSLCHSWD